ncbi:MAG: sodium-dependent transporter [Gammaproteobacteria bacterium]|nr:MAG: sodium-dependent transporter [Gammaproteobacteria bacterium]
MAARDHFDSRLGFILASAGSAVGLGNIWKFPFEVGAGGGAAFVMVYLACCFLLGFPVMTAEIAIGRHTQKNPIGAFRALGHPRWASVGFLGVLAGFLILSFYNVVAAWAFGYFLEMAIGDFAIGDHFGEFTADWVTVGLYGLIFMGATAYVVAKGVSHGIERAAKILMPALLVIVLILVVYALTLPHAMEGVKFYLQPDFSKVDARTIFKALGQAFFSLSLGMGALITYGSYVSKKTNIVSAAATITIADVTVAFLAGLMMFPFVAYLTGGDMNKMAEVGGGPGFIFQTLPTIFQQIGPILGRIIGAVFFLLLSFAAFTSTISLLEVPTAYLVDEKKIARPVATWAVAILIYLIGIPSMLSYGAVETLSQFIQLPGQTGKLPFLDFIALVANDTFLPLGGFLISVFTAYVWRKQRFNAELVGSDAGLKDSWLLKYVDFAISYVCPVVLGVIVLVTISTSFFGFDLAKLLFGGQ